jgi:hypothetical protein
MWFNSRPCYLAEECRSVTLKPLKHFLHVCILQDNCMCTKLGTGIEWNVSHYPCFDHRDCQSFLLMCSLMHHLAEIKDTIVPGSNLAQRSTDV